MRLPDAPLLEVVFELRWDVVVDEPQRGPVRFGYDPGFAPFRAKFDELMAAKGYRFAEVMGEPGPTVAHAITKRYRLASDQPFPLVQIGHGIFACNFSTDYDWDSFWTFAAEMLRLVMQAYPRSDLSQLAPNRLELRYIDIFDSELLGHASFGRFLSENTKINYKSLDFLNSNLFTGNETGHFFLRRDIARAEVGWFQMEAASAEHSGKASVIATSRVVKEDQFADASWRGDLGKATTQWLEAAHDVTSRFFKEFVSDELMRKFERDGAAAGT